MKRKLEVIIQLMLDILLDDLLLYLQDLKNDLDLLQDSEKLTENDRLHEQNLVTGRDKYKTLKAIRQGNTKKRIDEFESM